MSEVVTLAERHRRKMEHMRAAIVEIDALLLAYARQHGGRFIRYGSTAKRRAKAHSDVDIIVDFPGERAPAASDYAEDVVLARKLEPDVRAACYVSRDVLARAAAEGTVLA